MSAHTPGPWTKNRADELRGSNGRPVVLWNSGISLGARSAESEANTRLIAAAPDLLAALLKCRDEIAGLPHSLGYEFTHLPMIDAVIAKAVGP